MVLDGCVALCLSRSTGFDADGLGIDAGDASPFAAELHGVAFGGPIRRIAGCGSLCDLRELELVVLFCARAIADGRTAGIVVNGPRVRPVTARLSSNT